MSSGASRAMVEGAAGQRRHGVVGEIAGRDESHAIADKNAKTQIGAFAALDILQTPQAVGHAGGDAFDQKRVGGVGALPAGGCEQGFEDFLGIAGLGHAFRCRKGGGPSSQARNRQYLWLKRADLPLTASVM